MTNGIKDGIIIGIKDYIMGYYDMALLVTNLSFDSIFNGLNQAWDVIKNPETTLQAIQSWFQELYDIALNIDDIVSWLVDYKKGYYPSYLATNLWLSFVPISKFTKFVKVGDDSATMKAIIDWSRIAFIDKNTILGNIKLFSNTWRIYRWSSATSKIYKNLDNGYYYYRDTAWYGWTVWHQHLEVFDRSYSHIWVADAITWEIDYSKAVSGRSIKDIMK